MKRLALILCTSAFQMASFQVQAQSPGASEKDAARAERKAQGTEAARGFKPGEGNPVPEREARASRQEREAARAARKPAGAATAKAFVPGEGSPKPVATARPPREERRAERAAQRAGIKQANRAGAIPSYGEGASGTPKK